jgi:flagellar assembly protein FliH
VKVIKKLEKGEIPVQKISFQGDVPPGAHSSIPAWMEASSRGFSERQMPKEVNLEKVAYDKGFQEGERAALETAEKKMEAVMKRYAEAITEIGSFRRLLYSQVEREVVRLALEAAKKIVHREITMDPEIVQTLIRVARDRVTAKSPVTVRVNPADYNLVQQGLSDATRAGAADASLVVVSDRTVGQGGCLIETEHGDIDARIEEEFREVEHAFFDGGN